jgi:hypothetical protein
MMSATPWEPIRPFKALDRIRVPGGWVYRSMHEDGVALCFVPLADRGQNMGKPPTTDQELTARVDALEMRMAQAETEIVALDSRVTALEAGNLPIEPPPTEPPPDPDGPLEIWGGPFHPPYVDNTLPTPPPEPPPAGTLAATVTIPGHAPVTYYEAEGVDMGNYVDPQGRFTMSCKRAKSDAYPIQVDFRRVEGWSCAIFHFGTLDSTDGSNLPAYSAVVDGQTIEVPGHWKYAAWRWQSSRWPFPPTPIVELVERKLLPQFDRSVNHGSAKPHSAKTYTPMGLAGITPYMPGTGGRPDIGFVTDWQADYICNESSQTALGNVMAQGEAGGTIPWHTRDPHTGGPADATSDAWKGASFYAGNGNPQLVGGQGGDTCMVRFAGAPGATIKPPANWPDGPITIIDAGSPQQQWWCYGTTTIGAGGTVDAKAFLSNQSGREPGDMAIATDAQLSDPDTTVGYVTGTNIHGSGIALDIAHEPAVAYLPFLLTGDPYFLEILQYQCTFLAFATPKGWGGVSPQWGPGMGQTRAVAWATRNYLNAVTATPDTVPTWLLPKSTMQTMFDMCVAHLNYISEQTEPLRSMQRAVAGSRGSQGSTAYPASCYYQSWQEDFVQCVVAWGAMLYPELLPFARWHAKGICDRVNPDGMSGWCGGMPDAYQTLFQDSTAGPQYPNWEQAWTANQRALGLSACPPLANLFQSAGNYDYPNGMQAGLAISVQAGITEAKPALDHLADTLEAGIVAGKGGKDWKWSVARTG